MRKSKKSLGQHFLKCEWVVETLLKSAGLNAQDTVLEIGPGTGILTRALAARAKQVIAVEKDERLATALIGELNQEGVKNVEIISGDILRLLPRLAWNKYKVVANIPYYLTSRLLRVILEQDQRPKLIVLTIQKEVAGRIVAHPPHMNLLALSVQAFGNPEIIASVPASCFSPKPKVDSAIIRISDISDNFFQKNNIDRELFFSIARAAFGQKRKTLANSLASVTGNKAHALALIRAAKLNDASRPEELSLKEWRDLYHAYMPRL